MQASAQPEDGVMFDAVVPQDTSNAHVAAAGFYHCLGKYPDCLRHDTQAHSSLFASSRYEEPHPRYSTRSIRTIEHSDSLICLSMGKVSGISVDIGGYVINMALVDSTGFGRLTCVLARFCNITYEWCPVLQETQRLCRCLTTIRPVRGRSDWLNEQNWQGMWRVNGFIR